MYENMYKTYLFHLYMIGHAEGIKRFPSFVILVFKWPRFWRLHFSISL